MKKAHLLSILLMIAILLAGTTALAQEGPLSPLAPQGQIVRELDYDWKFETNQAADISTYDHRHMTVSSGCDVNGDGYDDILVGDRDFDHQAVRDDNGRAWLYMGGPSGLPLAPTVTLYPPYINNYGFFGTQATCAGDVNGDGYDDLMIGMDNFDQVYPDEGAVYIYHGSASGPSATPNWKARGNSTYAHFGLFIDSAGDVNNDGFDDIIVGTYENYSMSASHAYVWYGGSGGLGTDGLPANADWVASGPSGATLASHFGEVARGIGDVNGDGYDDIMVSAHLYDGAVTDQGAVFVWYGGLGGLGPPGTTANVDWSATGGQTSSMFGYTGDGIGDVNGDGFDDLAVGAYGYDNPETSEGKVFVWYGSASGLGDPGTPANADWSAEANVGAILGFAVRPAGDVDHDGYADLLTTAPSFPVIIGGGAPVSAGAWFVWKGSADGLGPNGTPQNADIVGLSTQANANFGRDDAGSGDVNGDGLSDIFVAARLYSNGQTYEGAVFGYYSFIRLFLPLVLR